MGNVCPDYCTYDCCNINYQCTTILDNCVYYYFDWTWVYWVCGVCVGLMILFTIIGLVIHKRRKANTMIVENTEVSYRNGDNGYNNGVYNGGAYYNGNGAYLNNNPNGAYYNGNQYGNYNPNTATDGYSQQGYEMGQPVYISGNQNYTTTNNENFVARNQGYAK